MKKILIISGILIAATAALTTSGQGENLLGMLNLKGLSPAGQSEALTAKVKRVKTVTVKQEDLLKTVKNLRAFKEKKEYDKIAAELPPNEKTVYDNLMLMNPPDESIAETFGKEAGAQETERKISANLGKIMAIGTNIKEEKILDFWQDNSNAYIILDESFTANDKYKAVECYAFTKNSITKARKSVMMSYESGKSTTAILPVLKEECQKKLPLTKKLEGTTGLETVQYSVGAKRPFTLLLNGYLVDWGSYTASYSGREFPLVKGENTLVIRLEKKGDFKDETMDKMLRSDFDLIIAKDGKSLIEVGNEKSDQDVELTRTFKY